MSKRKVQNVSYDDVVTDTFNCFGNLYNDKNFELEKYTFSDNSDGSDQERDNN